MPEFEVTPGLAYNWMIVVYFFLGGLAAGAYLFSVAANYWLTQFKAFAKNAALIVPVALAAGMFFLWIDLGRMDRVFGLLISFNPTSPISWGGLFLGGLMVISVIYAWACLKNTAAKVKVLAVVGVPFAILVAGYTGVLLNRSPGSVLWHSALLPVLFLNGGLISGTALAMLVGPKQEDNGPLIRLGRIVACLVVAELVMVAAELTVLGGGGTVSTEAARALLAGQFSLLFWGVEILAGGVIPAVILVANTKNRNLHALASVLLLVGIYTMRHIVVIGGQVVGQY
jgi:formate-dependent nitrite reductase membrane component NrfD